MDKNDLDDKTAQAAKTVFSYCLARTDNREEAEDLSQDILLEVLKSHANIRDEKAFYGFMWAVAANVYKNWCKKKAARNSCELDDTVRDDSLPLDETIAERDELNQLRRELSLLSEKYRKAAVLYYVNEFSCTEISKKLDISESMVKYLLFKARNILKEGMNMERQYGVQSYNPKQLSLMYFGEGAGNQFWNITEGNKITQNILWACYNDSLTEEEISVQIGVSLPYIENDVNTLVNAGLLIKKGFKFCTGIIIISKDLGLEVSRKTTDIQNVIAETVYDFLSANEVKIRSIDFTGNNMSHNTYLWQMALLSLIKAMEKFEDVNVENKAPVTAFGDHAYVWGEENPNGALNICQMHGEQAGLEKGCMLHFLDWLENPKGTHRDFFNDRRLARFYIRFAKNEVTHPDEYETEMIAVLIKKGYLYNNNGEIKITVPVYTKKEYDELLSILSTSVEKIYCHAKDLLTAEINILSQHTPVHLKDKVNGIANIKLFDNLVSGVARTMHNKDYLKTSWETNEMPTTFIVVPDKQDYIEWRKDLWKDKTLEEIHEAAKSFENEKAE